MDQIILIKGRVKFQITLDPGVWIFDDRKRELDAVLEGKEDFTEKKINTVQRHAAQWEREITEGAIKPPTLVSETVFNKKKEISGTYCMPFKPFLENAEPEPDAEKIIIETAHGEVAISMKQGKELLLNFSRDGKSLKEDGPVHCYFADGSNRNNPIKYVKAFRVE